MENEKDEPKDLSSEFLSSGQVDDALIRLKQKEIAEQIRSNKVIEGILSDICGGVREVAVNLENSYNLNLGRDIMETTVHARGNNNIGLCGAKGASVKLADNLSHINCEVCLACINERQIIHLEENNKTEQAEKQKETTIETDYAELVEEIRTDKIRLTKLLVRLDAMLDRLFKVMKTEPEPEASKAAAVQKANDAVPVIENEKS